MMEVTRMRATLNIPDELIKEVQKVSGEKSKTKAVTIAMKEYLKQQKLKQILCLRGKTGFAFDWQEEEKKEIEVQAGRERAIGKRG